VEGAFSEVHIHYPAGSDPVVSSGLRSSAQVLVAISHEFVVMTTDAESQRGDSVPEFAVLDGRLVSQEALRVAARLLHKRPRICSGATCYAHVLPANCAIF
jgi:hypothetical protein